MTARATALHRIRFRNSRATLGAASLSVLAVILILGPASASPAGVPTSFTRGPPYLGNESAIMSGLPVGCGNSLSFAIPVFNLTDGRAVEREKATSVPCAGKNSSMTFIEYSGLQTRTFTVASGRYSVKATWVVSFSAKLHVARGTATLSPSAVYYEWATGNLLAANGTAYSPSYYPELTKTVTGTGSYSHSYKNVSQSLFFNATLTSGQTYYLYLWVATQVGTTATPGTSSTLASVSMSSASRFATLTSWSVS
jgi:hypothetical protein